MENMIRTHVDLKINIIDKDSVFTEFPKIARYNREVIVTEKIDGTNAQILVTEDGNIFAGSRTRFITPDNDNAGFAKWVEIHKEELLQLGTGRHYGEWWGSGIQRGYGLKNGEKRFSLFNTSRWSEDRPQCCSVIPILWSGLFEELDVKHIMDSLQKSGSMASPGYMDPEGIVVFHIAGNVGFKKTFKNDSGKSKEIKQ